jgi:gliding motility-associated-like protein
MLSHLREILCFVFTIAISQIAVAQNLVPNPSFEDKTRCPVDNGDFQAIKSWYNPLTSTSPDYFNICATRGNGAHIPESLFGYQRPHSGDGMTGIIAWEAKYNGSTFTNAASEYIQTELSQSLQAGKKYCVSFYVSPTISPYFIKNYVDIDEIGVHFSSYKLTESGLRLNHKYAIRSITGKFMSDTAGWIKITGVYTAAGGEKWINIGVFGNTTPNHVVHPGIIVDNNYLYRSYMYIDDVNVSLINPNDTVRLVHNSSYCDKSLLPLKLVSSGTDGEYLWNNGSTDALIEVNGDGTYWCQSMHDCKTYIDTFHVRYDPNKKLDLGKVRVDCNNQPVLLRSNKQFKSYTWNDGSIADTLLATVSGKYFLKVSDECGTQTDTVLVYIQSPTPEPMPIDTQICQTSNFVYLRAIGDSIKWYYSADGLGGFGKQPAISSEEIGRHTIYVSQVIGHCESNKVPLSYEVRYQPKKELPVQANMCDRFPSPIGLNLSDVSYKWSTGDDKCCIVPNHEGVFKVAISNECGTYIDSIKVVFDVCDTCVKLPNAFTPDGNGQNDVFAGLITCPVRDYHMAVYNRWGNLVFETKEVNKGWDGRVHGVYAEPETYAYIVTYRSASTGRPKQIQGNVLLIR